MTIFLIGLVIFLIIFNIYFYNKIVSAKQNVNEAWSGVDVQLKRRDDLIPNLVEIVRSYASYEKSLFEQIAAARSQALSVGQNDIVGRSLAERAVEANLRSLLAIVEAYPKLKANEEYLKLQDELSSTEDQIASARRIYNSNTADYNTLILTFPNNIVAWWGRFKPANFFQNE